MTQEVTNATLKAGVNEIKRRLAAIILIPVAVFISLYFSPDIAEYAREGLRLCYRAVIGSVFPYLVLSDLFISYCRPERVAFLRKIFEKLFKINGQAISGVILGFLCGFPIGVKAARELYVKGSISRDECERLIGFSNNTGPAFAVSAVGASIRGSVRDGVIIYISMILSAVIVGMLFGIGKRPSTSPPEENEPTFNLTDSIKNAGLSTLTISSCVVFFTVICGLAKKFIKNRLLYVLTTPLIEVTSAEAAIAASTFLSPALSIALGAFALSFSGFSVHLQAKTLLSGTDLRMRVYYLEKICQGLIGATVATLISII